MPGGLTRVSASPDSPVVSSQIGGGSKDTWVLSEWPVEDITLLRPRGAPARPAERHAVACRAAWSKIFSGSAATPNGWKTPRACCAWRWAGSRAKAARSRNDGIRRAGRSASCGWTSCRRSSAGRCRSPRSPPACAIWFSSGAARLAARLARAHRLPHRERARPALRRHLAHSESAPDRVSRRARAVHARRDARHAAPLIFQLAAFSGMEMENMTRGHAWRFLDIGRRIERAMQSRRDRPRRARRRSHEAIGARRRCSNTATAP